jgi:hypothetical protein
MLKYEKSVKSSKLSLELCEEWSLMDDSFVVNFAIRTWAGIVIEFFN